MKSKLISQLLSFLIIEWMSFAEAPQNHRIYLFSKQNYYISEKEDSIVGALPGVADAKQYSLQLLDAKRRTVGTFQTLFCT